MIDPEPVWKSQFALIPQDPTGALGPFLIATYVSLRVSGKLDISPTLVKFDPPPIFTWVQPPFENALKSIATVPSVDPVTPATIIANGWAASVTTTQLIILPGALMNPPPPPTNGIVATAVAVIDPASVATGVKGIISELVSAVPVSVQADARLPIAIRDAFLGLKYIITGVDTKAPTPTPFTLNAPVF
jgi:hypothetical protein